MKFFVTFVVEVDENSSAEEDIKAFLKVHQEVTINNTNLKIDFKNAKITLLE